MRFWGKNTEILYYPCRIFVSLKLYQHKKTAFKRKRRGSNSRRQLRKILNSPPTMDIASLQLHMEQFPLEKKNITG